MITLLQADWRVCRWKNFENRSVFGEVMTVWVVCFFDPQSTVVITLTVTQRWSDIAFTAVESKHHLFMLCCDADVVKLVYHT